MSEVIGFNVGPIFDKNQVFDLPIGLGEICSSTHIDSTEVPSNQTAQNSRANTEEIGDTELSILQTPKKLSLILDLDHTLLHSKPLHKLSLTEEEEAMYSNQEDIFRWELMGMEYLTKLRPFVREFLEEANKLFELHIFTMGSYAYALQMAMFLDPQSVYFGSRVKSREFCTIKGQKGLDVVDVDESVAVILDDTESVWPRNLANLIVIDQYNYFAVKVPEKKDGVASLSEEGFDESQVEGSLSWALERLKEVHSLYAEWHKYLDVKDLLEVVWEDLHESNTEPPSTRKRSRIEDEDEESTSKRQNMLKV